MRLLLLLLVAASAVVRSEASANLGGVPSKRLKMQYATGPLLKFQIWRVFEEYMRVISQRYPDIRIEGENYLPQPIYRHIASFLSVFKLVLIGLIIVGKDPFAFFGMQAPSIWQWGQENKVSLVTRFLVLSLVCIEYYMELLILHHKSLMNLYVCMYVYLYIYI
uniref:Selenoprotein T n=1 Tax=Saimiri boliviensis boliviensis TaxID=39432 RepID=A0A2K6TVZ0_SAIBB